jgi:chemotaxis signal transduction protein
MKSACGSSFEIEPGGWELLHDEHRRRCLPKRSVLENDWSRGEQSETARTTIEPKKWFCFFRCDAGPMAVAVESVAGVLETDSLVRLPWSPPHVAGICSYHREVVPVVLLGSLVTAAGVARCKEPDPAAPTDTIWEKPGVDERAGCVVLVLKTEHGAWGICVEPENTVVRQESPEYVAPRMDATGPAVIGSVALAGTRFGILDAGATWRGLRSFVARWSGLLRESDPLSSLPSPAEPARAGPRVAAELCEA